MIERMKVYEIEWIDSCASNINWILDEELPDKPEPIKIHTFGVIVQENDECITLAQNYGMNPPQYCNLMTIPRGCIKNQRELSEVECDFI